VQLESCREALLMKRRNLWSISVVTSPEAEEAVADLLGRILKRAPSSYFDLRRNRTTVTVYLADKPKWARKVRKKLEQGLEQIGGFGLDVTGARVELRSVRQQEWAESWKHHFKPIEIGRRLLVKPSWSRRKVRRGQALVVIDPGLSFGTGQHPTTGFCLRELVRHRRAAEAQSFWDLGTGSGILAIAAAKLGYQPVEAMDNDEVAVRMARMNARNNGALARIKICLADVTRLPRLGNQKYRLICANLISPLLLAQKRQIIERLESGGVLVLAGILAKEFPQVQLAYEAVGLRLIRGRTEGEWRSGSFEWR
jgi:ribosomal protein L11 methyltransferase